MGSLKGRGRQLLERMVSLDKFKAITIFLFI